MYIKTDVGGNGIYREEMKREKTRATEAFDRLWSGEIPMTGWVKAPVEKTEELESLLNASDRVRQQADLMVVIGIGGSYMGAKAAIEALPEDEAGVEVVFAGTNFFSGDYRRIMEKMAEKETVLCVISKSGNTLEIKAGLDILRPVMKKKYGDRASERIITITGSKGLLREETEREGYTSFSIPENIGGRYSALTAAGLFPMAVSGIDVRSLLEGAGAMALSPAWDGDGLDYAVSRHLLSERGKFVEAIEFYDPRLLYLGEWIKQLYGESEGKEGKGIFPASFIFSTDLHSMGQFLQQGRQIFAETSIVIDHYPNPLVIEEGELKGKSLEEINRAAFEGVSAAHKKAGIPFTEIHLPELNGFYYGQLLYFLEVTCAVTAMLSGVDPFNQPGVEAYKEEMRKKI
ncbi:MAG TPA: glucose-6-phosphate isomerase [Candidatus Copromorpha excrementigallinarum]|uniref:Glucose-6-phosphate isomerase n=1 Tax=Candidatus Allocopromorpha excrementigallinarum TaxID=2840742 RepID=A0A9D1L7Z2_9FIRM|nr:glucose-6-phosphate isomerase [Candidatus Copromorpha excrementigallinarum]